MSPSTRSTAATVTWGALGALIPVLIAAAVLVWQGGALAEQIPMSVSVIAARKNLGMVSYLREEYTEALSRFQRALEMALEVRIRGLEDDRAGIAELKTDVGWIRREMESERGD